MAKRNPLPAVRQHSRRSDASIAIQATRLRALEDDKKRMLGKLDELPAHVKHALSSDTPSQRGGTDGFLKHAKSMSRRVFGWDVASYRQTFLDAADGADASGAAVMSLDALQRTLHSSGLDVPENELREIFMQIDIDGSNGISFAEFCDAANRAAQMACEGNADSQVGSGSSVASLRQRFVEAADSTDPYGIALMSKEVGPKNRCAPIRVCPQPICVCVDAAACRRM